MKHIPNIVSHNNAERNKCTSYLPMNDTNDTKQKPHGKPHGLVPHGLRHPVHLRKYKG